MLPLHLSIAAAGTATSNRRPGLGQIAQCLEPWPALRLRSIQVDVLTKAEPEPHSDMREPQSP
jgi:hypothetical protein